MKYHCSTFDFGSPEYDSSIRLRTEVLRTPLGLKFNPDELAKEFMDFHLGIFDDNGKLLGCLVMHPKEDGSIKMRQVAIDPSIQGKGLGTKLVKFSEVWSKFKGFDQIVLHAREVALKFYKNLNYEVLHGPFEEVSIPHYAMRKKLNSGPLRNQ